MSASDHPPPWRWEPARVGGYLPGTKETPRPGTLVLYDGADNVVLTGDGGTGHPSDVWATVKCDSPLARALIAAAPDMWALLWRLEYANDGHCPLCGTGLIDHSKCDLGALLARLDAARKAGG